MFLIQHEIQKDRGCLTNCRQSRDCRQSGTADTSRMQYFGMVVDYHKML